MNSSLSLASEIQLRIGHKTSLLLQLDFFVQVWSKAQWHWCKMLQAVTIQYWTYTCFLLPEFWIWNCSYSKSNYKKSFCLVVFNNSFSKSSLSFSISKASKLVHKQISQCILIKIKNKYIFNQYRKVNSKVFCYINLNTHLQTLYQTCAKCNESFGTGLSKAAECDATLLVLGMYLTGNKHAEWPELWKVFGFWGREKEG